jgi:hypothetical protein
VKVKNVRTIWLVAAVLFLCPLAVRGTTFTLSDSALMSLDSNPFPGWATMINITDTPGLGVQFDFLYPDPLNSSKKVPILFFTSSIHGGNGTLTGIDISRFDAFALKFTLSSAEGVSSHDAVGPVIVGALINWSDGGVAYRPEVIAVHDSYFPAGATSVTSSNVSEIAEIGFTCYIPYWWYSANSPSPWDPDGARISLLVEPAPNAVVIPEPASILLLGLGALLLRKRAYRCS